MLKSLNKRRKKQTLTSAFSGERYFYLWPRLSIKYWAGGCPEMVSMTLKQSGGSAEALKWHSAVCRGLCFFVGGVFHTSVISTGDWATCPLQFSKILFLDSKMSYSYIYHRENSASVENFHRCTWEIIFLVTGRSCVRPWEPFRSLSVALIRLSSEHGYKY